MHLVGVVLAGGASRRFGSDKMDAELDGRPLVIHAIDAIAAVPGIRAVVVAAPALPAAPAWLELASGMGATVVPDDEPFGGPLAGLRSALGHLPSNTTAVVVGGDMPRIDPELLAQLGDAVSARAVLASVMTPAGERPLPLAVSVAAGRRTADTLLSRGERRLRAFVESFEDRVHVVVSDADPLFDVDVPADLAGP